MHNGQTEGWMDGGDYNIPFPFLKKCGDKNMLLKKPSYLDAFICFGAQIQFDN